MRRPQPLRPGDTIGIASPASPDETDSFEQGIAFLTARGYYVRVSPNANVQHPHNNYLAGTDLQRAEDLNTLFRDTSVRAIFSSRGGYGSARLYPLLDWNALAAEPRIVLGYSDITSLHLAIQRKCSMVTFHGPMLTRLPILNETASALLWHLLEKPEPVGTLPAPTETMEIIVPGTVQGQLAGGCLTLLAHACGTPYAPDFRNKIVLIEDVGEAIYRADRYLTQLLHSGCLKEAAGFIIGTITDWQKHETEGSINSPMHLWHEFFFDLGKPTIANFPFGHEPNPLSLPLGVLAELNATEKTLTLLESATE